MTRCKYCRGPYNHGHASAYDDVLACRDRMLDRERRVVRVYYRIRSDEGREVTVEDDLDEAMIWSPGCHVFKVTVRRKAKP